ncbi:MAG TPA: hypothetical protein VFK05_19725 [Polyangiaceae bacterium]|nr:hypothetical protein [Polyangiaceae bacterium]
MAQLSASVGAGGTNTRVDVVTVQNLINQSIRTIVPLDCLEENGLCDQLTIEAITQFQRRVVKLSDPDGRVDPGGRTFLALTVTASGGEYEPSPLSPPSAPAPAPDAPARKPGNCYTDNPNEVATKNTVPAAKDVVTMLREGWSELNEQGARTLTAQFLHETGGGKYCFNWNLGNVKAKNASVLHMYLRNVWEGLSAEDAEEAVARSNGLAHMATADEIKAHGWSIPGRTIVVFQPPHEAARFLAYPSLAEGASGWMNRHKGYAAAHSEYLGYLNAGDCVSVAHALKTYRYYTGDETTYGRNMTSKKAEVDRILGPVA